MMVHSPPELRNYSRDAAQQLSLRDDDVTVTALRSCGHDDVRSIHRLTQLDPPRIWPFQNIVRNLAMGITVTQRSMILHFLNSSLPIIIINNSHKRHVSNATLFSDVIVASVMY